ncbi:hypothetical protein D3C86_1748390 [compost metagenome]
MQTNAVELISEASNVPLPLVSAPAVMRVPPALLQFAPEGSTAMAVNVRAGVLPLQTNCVPVTSLASSTPLPFTSAPDSTREPPLGQ